MTIRASLLKALRSTPRMDRDAATVELAKAYAGRLDALLAAVPDVDPVEMSMEYRRLMSSIDAVGRRLEATLDRLGMSPGARPARKGEEEAGGDPDSAALDGLREDAATGADGVDYAAAVDPSVEAADAGD